MGRRNTNAGQRHVKKSPHRQGERLFAFPREGGGLEFAQIRSDVLTQRPFDSLAEMLAR